MRYFSGQTLRFVGLLFFVGLSVFLFQSTSLGRFFQPEQVRAAIQSYGSLAPVIYILIYSVAPVFFVPGWIITVAGGLAFGAVWGTALTVIGATIGATLAFLVSRFMGREYVARLLKGKFKSLDDQAAAHGFQVIFFLRLVPLVPFNILDYVAGISKISLKDYMLGTFMGIIPGTFAYVYLGNALTNIYSWQFALAISLLILLSTVPMLYRWWTRRRISHPG